MQIWLGESLIRPVGLGSRDGVGEGVVAPQGDTALLELGVPSETGLTCSVDREWTKESRLSNTHCLHCANHMQN